jgi:glutamate-1-semialdehyde 2,1-aminomutase
VSGTTSQKAPITVSSRNDLVAKAQEITAREMAVYSERTKRSQAATERARKVMPAGVPSSFQAYDPWPVVVKHAAGAHMVDVDDNEYVDYDMGFGALFAGHMNPVVTQAVLEQMEHGVLYVTPCELNAEVGELLAERYGQPMWRPPTRAPRPPTTRSESPARSPAATGSSRSRAATTATTTR